MFKNSQNRQDKIGRVGSHSTKGSAAKGVVQSGFHEVLPDFYDGEDRARIEELNLERERWVEKKLHCQAARPSIERSREMIRIDGEIKRVNEALRQVRAGKRDWGHYLVSAMDSMLDQALRQKIIEEAGRLRKEDRLPTRLDRQSK